MGPKISYNILLYCINCKLILTQTPPRKRLNTTKINIAKLVYICLLQSKSYRELLIKMPKRLYSILNIPNSHVKHSTSTRATPGSHLIKYMQRYSQVSAITPLKIINLKSDFDHLMPFLSLTLPIWLPL